jgi:hypothetical protein
MLQSIHDSSTQSESLFCHTSLLKLLAEGSNHGPLEAWTVPMCTQQMTNSHRFRWQGLPTTSVMGRSHTYGRSACRTKRMLDGVRLRPPNLHPTRVHPSLSNQLYKRGDGHAPPVMSQNDDLYRHTQLLRWTLTARTAAPHCEAQSLRHLVLRPVLETHDLRRCPEAVNKHLLATCILCNHWCTLEALCRSHEDMSLKLLDLAVDEARNEHSLPADHFLANPLNIEAAKNMIKGDSSLVADEKTWLYTIVNNVESGERFFVA